MKHRYQSFTQIGRQLQSVGFIPSLPKKLPYIANNDEYIGEYLFRDIFVDQLQFLVEVIIPDIRISGSLDQPSTDDLRPEKGLGLVIK